jgi:hypothetical protein
MRSPYPVSWRVLGNYAAALDELVRDWQSDPELMAEAEDIIGSLSEPDVYEETLHETWLEWNQARYDYEDMERILIGHPAYGRFLDAVVRSFPPACITGKFDQHAFRIALIEEWNK